MRGLHYWMVCPQNLWPLSEGRVEGIGFPCGCKMAASVRLEVCGERASPDASATFIRKSNSFPRNPQHICCFVSLAEKCHMATPCCK